MADTRPFAGLSQEETNQGILLLLSQILEKLPRLDVNDRQIVHLEQSSGAVINTVVGVSTVNDVSRIGSFGINASGYTLNATYFAQHAANAGSVHIYNQITVAP